MKISEIIMQDIKGQNLSQPLTGKDIVIGPNGAGKTTRIQSLGISLLGYCPGKGKLPAETHKLATSAKMTVGLKLDGIQFARSFERKQKNKRDGSTEVTVSQSIDVSPSRGEKSTKQKEARIMAEVGNFPMMMDFNEFLSLSDAKRRDFIYSLSPITSSEWDKNKVGAYLKSKLLSTDLEVNNPDQYKIMDELITEALAQWTDGCDVQPGIQAMFEWAKVKRTHWNSEKENAGGAVKKLADLKNELTQTDRNIVDNKKQLESLQEQLSEVEQQLARDTEKKKAIDKHFKRMDFLQEKIKSTDVELDSLVDISDITTQIEQHTDKIKEVNVNEQVNPLQDEKQSLETNRGKLSKAQQEKYRAVADAEGEARSLNASLKRIKEQNGICLISPIVACDKDFTKYVEWAEGEIAKHNSIIQKRQAEYNNIGQQIEQIDIRLKEISASVRNYYDKASEQQRVNEKARQDISKLEEQKAERIRKRNQLADQLIMYKEELQKLQLERVEPVAPVDALEKRRDGLKAQVKEIRGKTQDQEKAKNTLANLKASMIDGKKATYYADCSKYLVTALGSNGLQGELVREIIDPIRLDIQENLRAMGIDKEFYFQLQSDTGKEIFQFGWVNDDGHAVNFDALSTGQQLLLLIAIMITMLDRAKPPLKVLAIDNIENLDRGNLERVIAGLDQIGDKLDNIILAGVIETKEIDGWKVWDLAAEEPAEGVTHNETA